MKSYKEYSTHLQKIAAFNSTSALLQWDQEVYMPPQGNHIRSRQLSLLSILIHEQLTDPALGKFLDENLGNTSFTDDERINILRSREDYEKSLKIPARLVEKMSIAQSEGFHAWLSARQENDFTLYQPYLDTLINLQREYASHLGTSSDPYETLMDQYDKGVKLEDVEKIFDSLIPQLHRILDEVDEENFKGNLPQGYYKPDLQLELGKEICASLGMNFMAGRQDLSEHPFTIGMHPQDVRITTRIDEHSLAYMLWSTIHECGHALYEQGLPPQEHGLPLGEATSLSIHESQSRLYENHIGRNRDFLQYWFPRIEQLFPAAMKNYDVEKYFHAVNRISPGLIRTESDELHYHFHIYIRFLIEKELMHEKLKISEVKERWNALYKEHLGLDVPDDKSGVLQDVHWSHGSIGYFPTYTLGSLYAAQFMGEAFAQISELSEDLQAGNYRTLLDWLRVSIHSNGRRFTSEELCRKTTGVSLSTDAFILYSKKKYLTLL